MSVRIVFGILALLAASGCTYNASVESSPAFNVYSNYSDKVPGRFALYVGDDKTGVQEVDLLTYACSAHSYKIETGSSFSSSVHQTFENLVEELEVVELPLTAEDLRARDFTAMISVTLEDAEFELTVIQKFWSGDMAGEAEYVARLVVEGHNGRVLGTTVEASEDYRNDAGDGCDGGAKAISQASAAALKELMVRLGERLVNAPRVRELAEGVPIS